MFKRTIDVVAFGSDSPLPRLLAYYTVLGAALYALTYFVPATEILLLGNGTEAPSEPMRLLPDGLNGGPVPALAAQSHSLLALFLNTAIILVGTLALMLPVTWVYIAARRVPGHDQAVVQTLIILPIVVAGIVLIVSNSLALAFSLAGVVAAVRYRTNLRDTRDVVFIFLAIAVGFAAGVQALAIGVVLSFVFNLVVLLSWRYDFGRSALSPTAASHWTEPLSDIAKSNGNQVVPDRDLMLSLTPLKATELAKRFERVSELIGPTDKKPRFNAVLSLATEKVGETQVVVQQILDEHTKRWILDEVVTNVGKPSEVFYLVGMRKSMTRDELITAVQAGAGLLISSINLELGESAEKEKKDA